MSYEERTTHQERVYAGRILNLRRDQVLLPDGRPTTREVVEHPGGVSILALEEDGYTTLLYCCDGWLRELYAQTDLSFTPADGTQILPLDALEIGREGRLLTFTIRSGDQQYSISVSPRSWPEEGEAA